MNETVSSEPAAQAAGSKESAAEATGSTGPAAGAGGPTGPAAQASGSAGEKDTALSKASEASETSKTPPPHPAAPEVTFRGNTYDLIALGSLTSGALVLFSCLTCNLGFYCLPFLPIVLGLIGVLAARQSVDEQHTRVWSWLGIAAGALVVLLIVAGIALYIAFIVLAIVAGGKK